MQYSYLFNAFSPSPRFLYNDAYGTGMYFSLLSTLYSFQFSLRPMLCSKGQSSAMVDSVAVLSSASSLDASESTLLSSLSSDRSRSPACFCCSVHCITSCTYTAMSQNVKMSEHIPAFVPRRAAAAWVSDTSTNQFILLSILVMACCT